MLQEAITREEFDAMERGIRPKKRKVVPIPEPTFPVIENEIKVSDIPEDYAVKLEEAYRDVQKNKDGVSFIGYQVHIELTPIPKKRGPGRPKEDEVAPEPKTLIGWMIEGEFRLLVRKYMKQIDQKVIHW